MASYFKRKKGYVVSFRLQGFNRQRIYGIKSLAVARQVANAKSLEEHLVKTGLHKPRPDAARIDAAEDQGVGRAVDDFEKSIVDRGKRAQHAQQTAAHVRRLLKAANVTRISQMDAGPIQAAAKKLMEADGGGRGVSPRTANAAIKAARQFSTWLFTARRAGGDVLHRRLHTYNEAADTRRARRALSADEFARLLKAARAGVKLVGRRVRGRGIAGPDRAVLYQVAVGTGFRMRACCSLTKASFHVEPKLANPFVRLAASFNKNGKERDQKIRVDLARMLHRWLKGKPDGLVWRPAKHAHYELMMKRDLAAARAAWLKEAKSNPKELEKRERSSFLLYQDAAGRFADFHSLRHTGISLVVRRAGLKVGQVWADHSSPLLTAKYSHLDVTDEALALEGLPATAEETDAEAAQAKPGGEQRERQRLAVKSGRIRKDSENRRIG